MTRRLSTVLALALIVTALLMSAGSLIAVPADSVSVKGGITFEPSNPDLSGDTCVLTLRATGSDTGWSGSGSFRVKDGNPGNRIRAQFTITSGEGPQILDYLDPVVKEIRLSGSATVYENNAFVGEGYIYIWPHDVEPFDGVVDELQVLIVVPGTTFEIYDTWQSSAIHHGRLRIDDV